MSQLCFLTQQAGAVVILKLSPEMMKNCQRISFIGSGQLLFKSNHSLIDFREGTELST